MDPPFDPVFDPWTFSIRYFDSEWHEIAGRKQEGLTADTVARRLALWLHTQRTKANGAKDEGNPYWNIALMTIEVQHG